MSEFRIQGIENRTSRWKNLVQDSCENTTTSESRTLSNCKTNCLQSQRWQKWWKFAPIKVNCIIQFVLSYLTLIYKCLEEILGIIHQNPNESRRQSLKRITASSIQLYEDKKSSSEHETLAPIPLFSTQLNLIQIDEQRLQPVNYKWPRFFTKSIIVKYKILDWNYDDKWSTFWTVISFATSIHNSLYPAVNIELIKMPILAHACFVKEA